MLTTSTGLTANGACLIQSEPVSRRGERLIAWIDTPEGLFDSTTMRVSEVFIPTGPQPGHAIIEIRRASDKVRKANRVAFNTPWESLQIGQRVIISRVTNTGTLKSFWVGSIIEIVGDIGKDSVTITAFDDRWLLQDIRIVGRFVVIPATGALQWQQGFPAEFNQGGRPNMLLSKTKSGGVPVPGFAPHPEYGLSPDEDPPASPSDSSSGVIFGESKACYWTLDWIFRYLHYACGPWGIETDRGVATTDSRFTGHKAPKTCPASVQWTPGIGIWLDSETQARFNDGRGQGTAQASSANRKGRAISADGYALLDFMEMILATGGGFTIGWWMEGSQGNDGKKTGKSILSIARAVGRGGYTGSTIHVLRGGSSADLRTKTKYWTAGSYTEDGRDLVTRAMGLGSLAKIERRVDTYITLGLKRRWTDADVSAFIARGSALSIGTADGMHGLFSEFPHLFASWKLDEAYNFQAGTSESSLSRAAVVRPIMPYLLSWVGAVAYDYVAQKYPIRFELSLDGSSWATTTDLTGLELFEDGTIYVPSLRELPFAQMRGSWHWTDEPFVWGAGTIAANEIRATVAIPCDHRIAAVCKLINSQVSEFDDTHRSPDLNRISTNLDRQDVLDLRGLYELWLRKDSYPVPESQTVPQAEDKSARSNALRNDLDMLRSHVRRHMITAGRLKRSGWFSKRGCFSTGDLELGKEYSFITSILANGTTKTVPIAAVSTAIQYLCGRGYTETKLHLG